VTVSLRNASELFCSYCGEKSTSDVWMLGLPSPYDQLCSRCLNTQIDRGSIFITTEVPTEKPTCNNCGDDLEVGAEVYCSTCHSEHYDSGYEDGQNNYECDSSHGCHNCGDNDEVYCEDCAKDAWNLIIASCDSCGNSPADGSVLEIYCLDCLNDRDTEALDDGIAVARAADAIEVSWE